MSKIKKYTIDEEIPRGAVFMYNKNEIKETIPDGVDTHGYPKMKNIIAEYFYFLVDEEKSQNCIRCGLDKKEWKGRWEEPLCWTGNESHESGKTTYDQHVLASELSPTKTVENLEEDY